MLSSPNACVRFAQNLMVFHCQIHPEIASGQIHDSEQKGAKNQHIHPAE
jgi:hypothetical protein